MMLASFERTPGTMIFRRYLSCLRKTGSKAGRFLRRFSPSSRKTSASPGRQPTFLFSISGIDGGANSKDSEDGSPNEDLPSSVWIEDCDDRLGLELRQHSHGCLQERAEMDEAEEAGKQSLR